MKHLIRFYSIVLAAALSLTGCSDSEAEEDGPGVAGGSDSEYYVEIDVTDREGNLRHDQSAGLWTINDYSGALPGDRTGATSIAYEISNPEMCTVGEGRVIFSGRASFLRLERVGESPMATAVYSLRLTDLRLKDFSGDDNPQPSEWEDYIVAGRMEINTGGTPIVSKEDYVACTVSFDHDNDEWDFTDVTAGVRGRGNSTWLWYPKKPYRIKFDKKQAVFGLDAAKSWVLLAEYRDPTDLMNAFVFELGHLLEMPYTNHNRYLELTLNGEYMGLYHLTEQVQQNKVRVAVDEEKGYLIQLDRDDGPELAPDAGDNFWSEVYTMPVCVKNPEDQDAAGLEKVRADLALLEKAIQSGNYADVCAQIEINTLIDFLIIQELIYNVELDAPRSMYMHKDVDTKWAMGPLWDFDAGFDFDWTDMYTSHRYFSSYRELVLGTDPANYRGTSYRVPGFFSDLFKMKDFVTAYKTRWETVRHLVAQAWKKAHDFYEANRAIWQKESALWPIDVNSDAEIRRMETWLTNRTGYLDNVINNYPAGK